MVSFCRCHEWVVNNKRLELPQKTPGQLYGSYKVCSDHFEDNQFMNAQQKNKLVHNAVPTLGLPPQQYIIYHKRKLPTTCNQEEEEPMAKKGDD